MQMKGSNYNIIQPCMRQLPNEINLGMCMDTTNNSVYGFLSFPKNRISDDLIKERIQKLNKYKTKILNTIIGYFYIDDNCYLIQEQSNVICFINDYWGNIVENINSEGMEMYKDVSMQFIYALAYILNFFDEINIGAAKSGIELASYRDQFIPCFTGLGFPEIFEEKKTSESNTKYFEDFVKQMNPSIEKIPSYKDIINNDDDLIPGSSEKRSEIIELCKPITSEPNSDDDSENEDEKESNDYFDSQYKKIINFSVFQECLKQLPNDVKLGMCIDSTNNTPIYFISFPKKRLSERLIDDRIQKLNEFKSKILIPITGFFYKDNRCYLIQEQNTVAFISDFWNNIKNNIESQGMEMYVDVAVQSIYALAYILKFFDEIGIGAAKNAYNLLSYHDQFEINFIALGFPEIFKENKKPEDNPKYFEEFCKQIYPKMKSIPSYNDVIENNVLNLGSKEKIEEIIFLCTGEKKEISFKEDPLTKYEINSFNVLSENIREFSDDVKIGCGNDVKTNKSYSFISCPEDRLSPEVINERIESLDKYHTKVLNAVIGYCFKNGRCYLIQEQEDVYCYLADLWDDFAPKLYQKGQKDFRSYGMQYIYAMAFILNFFDGIGIGAAKNAYELATYHDDYEICFNGLGFPEIFGENKKPEDNPKYFEDFCKRINSRMKIIPSYNDLVERKVRILGSNEKLAEILFICTGEHLEVPELTSKQCEEEEDFDYDDEDDPIPENEYKIVNCDESILTDPCFKDPFYHDEESHIYNLSSLFETSEYTNDGSLDFFGTSTIINSLGSEFQIGNIQNCKCISHRTPNDSVSIANEKLVITSVNNLVIPFCMHHSENQFVYYDYGEPLSESDFKIEYVGHFISFLNDLHENGFLYLRNNTDNIFINNNMSVCGFDTCMKIGSQECTSEMKDWDDEPTELTDLICLGTFIYYLLTKVKLFGEDPESNRAMFKKGIKISSKEIGTRKAKMIRKLLSPDLNVRKSVDWFYIIDSLQLNGTSYFFNYLYTYYLNDLKCDILMKNFRMEAHDTSIYLHSYSPPLSEDISLSCINLCIQLEKLFETIFILNHEKFDFRINCAKKAYIYFERETFGIRVVLPCGETNLQWDNENGIIIAFPNFKVKMQQDGSLIYPDGNFRKRMEDGNLIIEGEGMTLTHKGLFFEFKTEMFSFKMIDEQKWEIKSPIFLAKYSPEEIFVKVANTWVKCTQSHYEIGFNGIHIAFNEESFQLKYSFMEILTKYNENARFRFFNKEYIPTKDILKSEYHINFYDIPLIEMPKVPMQSRNKKQDLTTAEERSIEIKEENILHYRDDFDEFYEKLKSDAPKPKYFVPENAEIPEIEEPKPGKKMKKKKSKKENKTAKKNNNHNDNNNDNNNNYNNNNDNNNKTDENQTENLQLPLLENTSSQILISQEELPQNFKASQAIGKIKNLLEGGEVISYFATARIINFLKPKRIRKIVVTSSGRIFFTNIGGDGILGNIEINKKSSIDINGCHIKIHGSKKSFHFIFVNTKDCIKFGNKVKQCINISK